jgi:hypothetical protein
VPFNQLKFEAIDNPFFTEHCLKDEQPALFTLAQEQSIPRVNAIQEDMH